ncbi:cobalt transport protein [Clostridiales bacterium oral taxon 876 str. F0540]|nr:cobalt transport protein [Clostridiales bacterium oral taxon 876 str. F0540]
MPSFSKAWFFYVLINCLIGEIMDNFYKSLHVVSTIIFSIMLLVITFSTNNPIILFCVLCISALIFAVSKSYEKFKMGFMMFLPLSIITIIINMIFVQQGRIIIFSFGSRSFTLESLIYALILSFKLLLIIYIFSMLGIMMDSDRAVSYFSMIMPKTTLTFMIALKLFPAMKRRLGNLREIYGIRGIEYDAKNKKDKILSYLPILSVLLEDSLEKSFDIGEAAYVRGFLSTKRSIYDKQKYRLYDYVFICSSLLTMVVYLCISFLGFDNYDIYNCDIKTFLINKGSLMMSATFILLFIELLIFWRKLVVTYEIY